MLVSKNLLLNDFIIDISTYLLSFYYCCFYSSFESHFWHSSLIRAYAEYTTATNSNTNITKGPYSATIPEASPLEAIASRIPAITIIIM